MNLQELGVNDQIIYALFGGEENYNEWFKSALREELERRQLRAAREQANALLQNAEITIPQELL
jgi:hypothetical protein